MLLVVDLEVCIGRFADEDVDWRASEFLWLSLSLAAWGIPSHFELTLGTVGGSLAEETPGSPTAITRPL